MLPNLPDLICEPIDLSVGRSSDSSDQEEDPLALTEDEEEEEELEELEEVTEGEDCSSSAFFNDDNNNTDAQHSDDSLLPTASSFRLVRVHRGKVREVAAPPQLNQLKLLRNGDQFRRTGLKNGTLASQFTAPLKNQCHFTKDY